MLGGLNIPVVGQRQRLATDFADFAAGTELSSQGFTYPWGASNFSAAPASSSDSLSGKRLVINKTTSDASRMAAWTAVGSVTDVEVLARVKSLNASGSDHNWGQIDLRAGGTSGAEDAYYATFQKASGLTYLGLVRIDGGSVFLIDDSAAFSWDTTNWFWLRMRAVGTAIKAKAWQSGSAEPASWTVEATDSTFGSGVVGFGTYYSSIDSAVDWFSVALGGATAPGPSG